MTSPYALYLNSYSPFGLHIPQNVKTNLESSDIESSSQQPRGQVQRKRSQCSHKTQRKKGFSPREKVTHLYQCLIFFSDGYWFLFLDKAKIKRGWRCASFYHKRFYGSLPSNEVLFDPQPIWPLKPWKDLFGGQKVSPLSARPKWSCYIAVT